MKPGKGDDAIVAVGSDAAYVDGLLQRLSDSVGDTLAFLPMWRCERRLIGGSPEGRRGASVEISPILTSEWNSPHRRLSRSARMTGTSHRR